ncbi:heavy metal-binding domain-containing protein [Robiginitomaculum antarcticum]|uniref:heavy metal-binding domain-containing protein n=1 Tax=Robiginitomaculum antarcticum TaxID=437507 RepID=UPI00039D29A2|nr:heavy metal-binding domain-containing protein [Robiginitomaculum antarcticum]
MLQFSRRGFLASSLALTACSIEHNENIQIEKFICPPCGCSLDHVEFDEPGPCPDCGMSLAPKHETDLGFEPKRLAVRAGSYEMPGGVGHEHHRIQVHYYKPERFNPDSSILLIIPGAGRNSVDYRNAWLGAAKDKNILIAALGYSEDDYDLAAYNMGGVIRNFVAENVDNETRGVIRVSDDDIKFQINPKREEWLFNDFDRIFESLKIATGSMAKTYDVFGHSAGGQIINRMALFYSKSQANRIVAANAGWYTLPELSRPLPTGLGGSPINESELANAFASKLTILLGENDNSDSAGGTLLRTPIIDEQGLGRLARGKNFYAVAKAQAQSFDVPFNWTLEIVPKAGHDFEVMSRAAANMLFP